VTRPRYRRLAHIADVRLAVWGADEGDLLRNAVRGALACALDRSPSGTPARWVAVERWPDDLPARLVRTVNEALYLLYVRRELVLDVRASATGAALAVAPLPSGWSPVTEVKAATFHALDVGRGPRLRAVITLDL
jgi:SHS2 domain-containing protein